MKITQYLKTKCPHCESKNNNIIKTWKWKNIKSRRHYCISCKQEFVSHESIKHSFVEKC